MNQEIQEQYNFSDRLQGDVTLSLFDKYYLQVSEKKLKKSRDFKLELATIDPEPIHEKDLGIRWLAAMLISILAAIYLLYDQYTSGSGDLITSLIIAAVATVLSVIFLTLFRLTKKRKWVLQTRASHYPLIEIPYNKQNSEAASKFLQLLQGSIRQNLAKKGYDENTLFAGEMRMLRRLAKNKVLSDKCYDKAKKHMLESGKQVSAA